MAIGEHLVEVGTLSGVYGVKGWLRVYSYTDPPENILSYGPWLVGDGSPVSREVLDGGVHGKGIIAQLAGIDDRDLARRLVGATIRVPRKRFAQVAAGEYYCSDLIGLQVRNHDGVAFGEVLDVMETGANDVLVIQGERRRLVPFLVPDVIRSVDLGAGTMDVDWDADF